MDWSRVGCAGGYTYDATDAAGRTWCVFKWKSRWQIEFNEGYGWEVMPHIGPHFKSRTKKEAIIEAERLAAATN